MIFGCYCLLKWVVGLTWWKAALVSGVNWAFFWAAIPMTLNAFCSRTFSKRGEYCFRTCRTWFKEVNLGNCSTTFLSTRISFAVRNWSSWRTCGGTCSIIKYFIYMLCLKVYLLPWSSCGRLLKRGAPSAGSFGCCGCWGCGQAAALTIKRATKMKVHILEYNKTDCSQESCWNDYLLRVFIHKSPWLESNKNFDQHVCTTLMEPHISISPWPGTVWIDENRTREIAKNICTNKHVYMWRKFKRKSAHELLYSTNWVFVQLILIWSLMCALWRFYEIENKFVFVQLTRLDLVN